MLPLLHRDPIERVRKLILELKIGVEASDLKQIEKAVKKEIDEVVEMSKVTWLGTPPVSRRPAP